MADSVKALVVSGNNRLRGRLSALLTGSEGFEVDSVRTYDAAVQSLAERRHDVCVIDHRLGARTGLELMRARDVAPVLPAAVMLVDDEGGAEAFERAALEATEVLIKSEIDGPSLRSAIRHAIAQHRAIKTLLASHERFALATRALDQGLWDWDLVDGKMLLSARWNALLGRQSRSVRADASVYFKLVHGDDLMRLRAAIDAHLAGRTPRLECEHRILGADGGWRGVVTRGVAIRGPGGEPVRMIGWLSNLAPRQAVDVGAAEAALRDPLTGLPNRALMFDRLEHVARRTGRDPDLGCALMLVDVDRFGVIGDYMGHGVAEELLRALGRRLARVLRPGDTVGRIEGDEFALLLDGVRDHEQATVISDRLWAAIAPRFCVCGHELPVTVSIGGALAHPGMSAASLMAQARAALETAKRQGGERFVLFESGMGGVDTDRAIPSALEELIERDLVAVKYQPIVDLQSGGIRGFEALARWPEDETYVTPAELIAIAEEEGLIADLGAQVLRKALRALARWRNAGLVSPQTCMSVNISAVELEDPLFPVRVRSAISAAALPPRLVRLELRENTLMRDPERIETVSAEVCTDGVALHLDNFGTGYSSLPTLQRLPLDGLKIDRSFVSMLDGSSGGGQAIVRSTMALGRSLGLQVIAEGIEHPAQLAQLRRLGCRWGQGFAFSRPVGDRAVPPLLAGWVPGEVVAAT